MPFTCSICAEESTRICARCTKDACDNHLCEKCLRCSDCCECEVALAEPTTYRVVHPGTAKPAAPSEPEALEEPLADERGSEPNVDEPNVAEPSRDREGAVVANGLPAESEEPNGDAPRPTQYNG